MGKHLVLVGGGHAHLAILKQVRRFTSRGHRVTLVSPTPFHDYSGMGPGLLSGRYRISEVRFNIARMTTIRGGRFVEGAAAGIDPEKRQLRLDNGERLDYDVISFNTGSGVDFPLPGSAIGRSIFPVKPIAHLFHAREAILRTIRDADKPLRLLVIGGGPAGCEITGNLQELVHREQRAAEITLVAGSRVLGDFPVRLRDRVRSLLAKKELRLIEGMHVSTVRRHEAVLEDGRVLEFDLAFVATGIAPCGPFQAAGLSADGRGLVVNEHLQSPAFTNIFGGGDCICFEPRPLDRVGVYAVRESPVLRHNLLAALEDGPLARFRPQRKYLLIFNLGLRRAVATGYGFVGSGLPAWWLKSYLDRSFMKRYQEIG